MFKQLMVRWSGVALAGFFGAGCGGAEVNRPLATNAGGQQSPQPQAGQSESQALPDAKAGANVERVAIAKASWGRVDGQEAMLYTLTNANGLVMKVTNYGGIITELHVPDKHGKLADIVLGYDHLDEYVKATPYFGAIIGRVANRIKNAQFNLEGKTYKLAANMGENALHGGKKGWDKVVWTAEASETPDGPALKLTYTSKDGEEGYPGTVHATNVYTLTNQNELKVEMSATTDKTTIINMAHHSYWNLAGHDAGTILDHVVAIKAREVAVGDPVTLVLDGKVQAVKGTPFDFTVAKPIGKDLQAAGGKPIGFDHNWIVDGDPHALREVLRVQDPKSGRVMTVFGDQPGVQFYSGNFLDGSNTGKGGVVYKQYSGICVETQRFPNAINVAPWREQVILRPGQVYESKMVHRFSAE